MYLYVYGIYKWTFILCFLSQNNNFFMIIKKRRKGNDISIILYYVYPLECTYIRIGIAVKDEYERKNIYLFTLSSQPPLLFVLYVKYTDRQSLYVAPILPPPKPPHSSNTRSIHMTPVYTANSMTIYERTIVSYT